MILEHNSNRKLFLGDLIGEYYHVGEVHSKTKDELRELSKTFNDEILGLRQIYQMIKAIATKDELAKIRELDV